MKVIKTTFNPSSRWIQILCATALLCLAGCASAESQAGFTLLPDSDEADRVQRSSFKAPPYQDETNAQIYLPFVNQNVDDASGTQNLPSTMPASVQAANTLTCSTPTNVSASGVASQSSNWPDSRFRANLAIDGDVNNFTHTAANQSPASWQLALDSEQLISEIVLHNRRQCCGSRLRDITVSVLDASGSPIFVSALLNPENILNSPEKLTVTLPEAVVGHTVLVERTPDPDQSGVNIGSGVSESDVLSLAEVEVFACEATQVTGIIWSAPINTTGKEQLLEGTVLFALNGGGNVTVNNGGLGASQKYTFTASKYNQLAFAPSTSSKVFANVGSASTGHANFDTLINTFAYATSGVTDGLQTIDGLTPGNTYRVQIFYNDQRSAFSNRTMTYGNGDDPSQQVDVQASGVGWGQHAIGTFTATDTSINLDHITNGFGNVHYNAILVVETSGSAADITVELYGDRVADAQNIDLFMTFSEDVIGLAGSDLIVRNGAVQSVSGEGRYYTAVIEATAPGMVEVSVAPNSVTGQISAATNAGSAPFSVDTNFLTGESWTIDDQASWQAANAQSINMVIQDGYAEATNTGIFRSATRSFSTPQKMESITFKQAPTWDNWTDVSNVGPSDGHDAPVLLSLGNDNYYFLALGSTHGYHAWHSTDMVNWVERGPVTPPGDGRWVTSAEYKEGQTYIYSDAPNDMTPHLFVDTNLDDGVPGVALGAAFVKPGCGSDASFFRSDTDGLFHIIYEDWGPINAGQNSWDSPLAGHASSADGFSGFVHHEHMPPVDDRTTPTGVISSYTHPYMDDCTYAEHLPAQDAYGDWTTIKIGDQYYLFADYDPHDAGIKVARFTSDSIYKEFDLVGSLGNGHPDPTVGFAEGQFYLITQQSTDYVSPGPWVDGVEARVGVDTNGNGRINHWTAWQTIQESYDHKPGYARVVETTSAQVNVSGLSAGYGFQFQFRLDNGEVANSSPIMDRVEMEFGTP